MMIAMMMTSCVMMKEKLRLPLSGPQPSAPAMIK